MIPYAELKTLIATRPAARAYGAYLRGATAEVDYATADGPRSRTHLIVDAKDFPIVRLGVEGSPALPVARHFLDLAALYDDVGWELADPDNEADLIGLIAGRRQEEADAAERAIAAGRAREAARIQAAIEAEALRTAELKALAAERLVAAYRTPPSGSGWPAVIADLDTVIRSIARETDQGFIADLASRQRRFGSVRLTDKQFRWVADVLDRTGRQLARGPAA